MDYIPLPGWDATLPLPKWDRPAIVAKAEPVRAGYPLRGNHWTHPGEIHAHLLTGEHRGKWPAEWVRGLTNAEAEALHSDDHEGRVKWQYVPGRVQTKPAPAFEVPAIPKSRTVYAPAYCPPGATH